MRALTVVVCIAEVVQVVALVALLLGIPAAAMRLPAGGGWHGRGGHDEGWVP